MADKVITPHPLHPIHLDMMELRELELSTIPEDDLRAFTNCRTAWTYVIDGRILCIAGYFLLRQGVAEVFVIPSIYASEYALPFQRAVKKILNLWVEEMDLHRIQTHSHDDDETSRWMQSLGFIREGWLPYYSSNKLHYNLWARYHNGQ